MTNVKKECTIRSELAAYNNFNIEGMVALVDPKVVFQDISDGEISAQTQGVTEFCQLANKSKDLFSSRYQETTNLDFAADVVNVNIAFKGVLATDFPSGMK